MSKAIQGVAALAGDVGLGAVAFFDPAIVASPWFDKVMLGLLMTGISDEAGAIGDALTQNRGVGITTRQAAASRQIVYGQFRVGGMLAYQSTTGSGPGILNEIVVLTGHEIEAFVNAYVDGRKVYFDTTDGNPSNITRGGYNFGGFADGNDHVGPNGLKFNFGGNVFVSAHFGDQPLGTVDGNMTANDPAWGTIGPGSPSLVGCAYVYFHALASASLFPQIPETKFTILGKNTIFDPRTNTTSWTQNAALIIADVLTNSEYGFGYTQAQINTEQLIAAANICDELVATAAQGDELRYTINTAFDTSSMPGDILDSMLAACAGRIAQVGGQLYIFPAAFQGSSFTWDESALVDSVEWNPYRSKRDLFNHVSATFTAPNYPYSVTDAGSVGSSTNNLYDANGYDPGGTTQDNFGLEWQPASAPSYASDPMHGFPVDTFTTQDGGIELWKDLNLKCVISVACSQRIMKINLLRNRFQGSGTLSMITSAYAMMPVDAMEVTFTPLGWNDQLLEVTGVRFTVKEGDDENGPSLYTSVDVDQTDPSIYEWSTTEEQTILALPAGGASQVPYVVAPPTNVVLDSGANTAVIGADGVTIPRISVTWDAPADPSVVRIQIQYQQVGSASFIDTVSASVTSLQAFITGVVAGQSYNVQIRSVRANSAASVWVGVPSFLVSDTLSNITSAGISSNIPFNINNDAMLTSEVESGSITVQIFGPGGAGTAWDNFTGQGTQTFPAAVLSGLMPSTEYTVVFDVATQAYDGLTDFNDSLSDSFITLGSLMTVAADGTGGVSGGGASGGAGPRVPGCTIEGTMLDGWNGIPTDNRIIKAAVDAGQWMYLQGRDVPERVLSAEWIEVDSLYRITVGDASFECSGSHTLKLSDGYQWVENIRSGSMVETRDGYQPVRIEQVHKAGRVLKLHLEGPSHEYSVSGVLSHNAKIAQPITSDPAPSE